MDKQELFNASSHIINLANEDPEDIYVAKWQIENYIKEINPFYKKKPLAEFIQGLNLQDTLFVYDNSCIPFSVYYNHLFISAATKELETHLIEALSQIDYDLSRLIEYTMDEILKTTKLPDTYFLIGNKIMIIQ